MKIIGVIPARYQSRRLPGKPLSDLCGKPMIWWVYQQMIKVEAFSEIYVATDDERIAQVCDQYQMPVMITAQSHKTPTERIHEVSTKVTGDIFVFVGSDEPLVRSESIDQVIRCARTTPDFFVANAMTTVTNPAEVIDFSNLKVIASENGNGIYTSRSPVPYPRGSIDFTYKKFVGICALSRMALDFFVKTPQSLLEKTEECDLLRFIEHKKNLKFVDIDSQTLSVDTPKDLETVRSIIQCHIEKENL